MPVPMMQLNQEDIENNAHVANQSTPQSTEVESASVSCAKVLNMSIDSPTDVSSVLHSSSDSDRSADSKSSEDKRVAFYIDECSQDSGLGVERTDSRDSKDSVSPLYELNNLSFMIWTSS